MTAEGGLLSIVDVLNREGYAATLELASNDSHSSQLCQHHCPVVSAASEFPELCQEETSAFSQALGQHVTRLATLAQGDPICTTLIPQQVSRQQMNVNTHTRTPRKSREVTA
jgi:predicted ArsR family transcriptional regulator